MQSGSFIAGQKWEGARETWTSDEHKGTMRDGSQLQAHGVQPTALLAAPSSVTRDPLFLYHLKRFCPFDRLMKTENISSETPFLKRKLPRQHFYINRSTNI